MSIYIVSNRKVVNGKFKNLNRENLSEYARREFRVAKVNDINKEKYSILPEHEGSYSEAIQKYNEEVGIPLENLAGTAYMFADLYNQMLKAKDSQSDCLFFIHGFANKFKNNLEHLKLLNDLYITPKDSGIDHLIYVSWPSRGSKLYYDFDQEQAEETGRSLGGLYSKLLRFFIELFNVAGKERCSNRIHLAAHSMGNHVLEHMLNTIPEYKLKHFIGETLLLHADIDFDVYEKPGSFTKLEKLSNRTHIYTSKSDEVLSVLSTYTKNGIRRLGHKGPRNFKDLPDDTFVVDTTNAGRAKKNKEKLLDHWGYLYRENEIEDIKQVLLEIEEGEISTRKPYVKHKNYYVLKK